MLGVLSDIMTSTNNLLQLDPMNSIQRTGRKVSFGKRTSSLNKLRVMTLSRGNSE